MKISLFPVFLVLFLVGCQQLPALPAGVVGMNLTYTIASTDVTTTTPAPKDADTVKPEVKETPKPAQPE